MTRDLPTIPKGQEWLGQQGRVTGGKEKLRDRRVRGGSPEVGQGAGGRLRSPFFVHAPFADIAVLRAL